MFDHSNTVPFHSLNKITDALYGIQLGDTPNAVQASALKLLAVRYRKTNLGDQAMINLWLNGPDAGQPVVDETSMAAAVAQLEETMTKKIKPQLEELREQVGKTVKTELTITIGDYSKNLGTEVRHYVFEKVLIKIAARLNVYLPGPAGSGKTTIAEQVAEALGLPFYAYGAIGMAHEFEGFMNAQGNYVESMLYKAFKNGGMVLFDEMDGSNANALLRLNAILANNIAAFPNGEMVKKHPDFVVIATGNTFGHGATAQYVGRNPLDGATLDRYVNIPMGYDEELERSIAGNDAWVDFVQAVRHVAEEHKMRYIVSPRASINGAILIAAGDNLDDIKDETIFNKGFNEADLEKIRTDQRVIKATQALNDSQAVA